MKITETHCLGEWDNTTSVEILMKNEDGDEISFYLSEGEPEDMSFGRDLSEVFGIAKMLKFAYEAGKRDEKLEYVLEEEKDD
jgi:hypothetical protein|nr:MAG TPA: hypothetical protein [Caudoviricetes sp.]DAS50713.1 MAG TPA: hypothetical protein [Caudoviricetes sp.]